MKKKSASSNLSPRRRTLGDRFLTFILPTENDVLVPVLALSIDVVVVSFVVDLKLPNSALERL